ncbi:MAG: hypothetical protein EXQ79_10640 [Acidimicrobiia bacterium]|nr:hypothetical protein [Acidimicrobiia bacterium]
MNERRFINQYQPQTLVSATVLCYIHAVFLVLSGKFELLLFAAALGYGAYGIANEKKWGYTLAVAAAVLWVLVMVTVFRSDVLSFPLIINFMFDIALVALLLHPQSRDYQKIWFS